MRDEFIKDHERGALDNERPSHSDAMINSDALMANCSFVSREQMIEEQLEKLSPFNREECPDQTEDPIFIQNLSKDIMAFWK